MEVLGPEIDSGTPIVGLEPSCVVVFRDELTELFPDLQRARKLAGQVFLLSEFLDREVADFDIPKLNRHALVQLHCHHKSLLGTQAEQSILDRLGVDYEMPDSGCCGMAGACGLEPGERYRVSMGVGERVLLPAVRSAGDDTLLIANGFSCREQGLRRAPTGARCTCRRLCKWRCRNIGMNGWRPRTKLFGWFVSERCPEQHLRPGVARGVPDCAYAR
jgi:Fe-S oxidoreductase